MPSDDREIRDELLQLIRGAPQPGMDLDGIAAQIGVPRARVDEEVERLIRQRHVQRRGDRLVVVERAEGFD
jgi:DNA-binding IclR family transcriptional regulator